MAARHQADRARSVENNHSRQRSATKKSFVDQVPADPAHFEGKYIVNIEVCRNCKEHQWCTRHDEARYNKIFDEVQLAIQNENPDTVVLKNNKVGVPVLGGFEVSCLGTLLSSKIKSGVFPSPSAVASLVKSYLQDKLKGLPVTQYDLNKNSETNGKDDSRGGIHQTVQQPKANQSTRSPINLAQHKGTRGRNGHYSGKGNVITPYQFVISSTFAHGKRGTQGRSLSINRADSIAGTATAASGFYNPEEGGDPASKDEEQANADNQEQEEQGTAEGQYEKETEDRVPAGRRISSKAQQQEHRNSIQENAQNVEAQQEHQIEADQQHQNAEVHDNNRQPEPQQDALQVES